MPGPYSLPPVSVTVVSVKTETMMSLCPLISIMHCLTAADFIFTATSLRAFGINSKCCDLSRQLVGQTASAHRAETGCQEQVTTYFQLHNIDCTITYMACLSAQSPLSKTRNTAHVFCLTDPCNWCRVSPVTQTVCHQTSALVVLKHLIFFCLSAVLGV